MDDRSGHTTAGRQPFLTLGRKLSVLVSFLLVVVVALEIGLSYHVIRDANRAAAAERMRTATTQFGGVAAIAVGARLSALAMLARDERVHRALVERDDEATAWVAQIMAQRNDNDERLELRTADGYAVPGSAAVLNHEREGSRGSPIDSGVSRFYLDGDRGVYRLTVPVRSDSDTVGWLTQVREVSSGGGVETFQKIIGPSATLLVGNRGGQLWLGLGGVPQPLPVSDLIDIGAVVDYEVGGQAYRLRVDTIAGTPWRIGVALPAAVIDAPAHTYVRRAASFGALLIVIGTTIAWLISRSVTRPIVRLRAAAGSIAEGAVGQRVREDRADEIGDLAHAFNVMAERVEQTHAELEQRWATAQALATELETTNVELEQLAVEADVSRLEAQAASRAKSDFLATMSHEIRTPINAMLGFTDLLATGIAGSLTPEQIRYLDRIKSSGAHLTTIVDDVLDFARIESGQMRMRVVVDNAHDVARYAIATVEPAARGKHIRITVDGDETAPFIADPSRVEQVLLNLLSNAIKFTPERGEIRVTCQADVEPTLELTELYGAGGRWTRISVTDSGPGVPEDRREDIFDPFVQGESGYTRSRGGTGLGLSISRRLARLMGGEVTLRGRNGHGASFSLWLRCADSAQSSAQAPDGEAQAGPHTHGMRSEDRRSGTDRRADL